MRICLRGDSKVKGQSRQPMDGNQSSIPQMKAGDVPFHLPYGSLICTNRLQSDRSKCRGMLVDPGTPRGNAEIRCFEPDLNDIFLLRKLKFLISLDSPRSPPSNEIW